MSFDKLNVNNPLFNKLSINQPPWWQELVRDSDINIQVRKDNYIDVYYNGGAIIKELKYAKQFTGKIHFEYIPLQGDDLYIKYKFNESDVEIDKARIQILNFNNFKAGVLDKIKKRISLFVTNDSEKGIQASFIKNDPYYVDAEFQYAKGAGKAGRIDLVRIDTKIKKIVFIEVKTMGDPRLYTNEITEQMEQYMIFIKEKETLLLDYYKRLFEVKQKLGILPKGLINIPSLVGYTICKKPLLLFGDCVQKWIGDNHKNIDSKIKNVAIGCYYFGKPKYNVDIVGKTRGNRYIY